MFKVGLFHFPWFWKDHSLGKKFLTILVALFVEIRLELHIGAPKMVEEDNHYLSQFFVGFAYRECELLKSTGTYSLMMLLRGALKNVYVVLTVLRSSQPAAMRAGNHCSGLL